MRCRVIIREKSQKIEKDENWLRRVKFSLKAKVLSLNEETHQALNRSSPAFCKENSDVPLCSRGRMWVERKAQTMQ